MTRMQLARSGKITDEMKVVAKKEMVDPEFIRKGIASGTIVILKNIKHDIEPIAIGKGLFTKTNSNIGTSKYIFDMEMEKEKARISEQYGADTIMDLSTGKTEQDLITLRKWILENIHIPLGTVPIYQVALRAIEKRGAIVDMTEDDMFNVVEEQAKEGVDYFTIHAGVTRQAVEYLKRHPRMMGIVSRGGTFMASWIIHNDRENPFYEHYDYLLEMAKDYDFSISLGDGMRPGAIFDSTDYLQIFELLKISELVEKSRKANIQAFVEGPGHIPAHQVQMNMQLQKSICKDAPFYVLGPIVTDIAPGYDHITSAIGGTLAAIAGADFLCYVTPAEHLGLPNVEDVKRGVVAARIAAHAADIIKRPEAALEWDRKMDIARKNLDWEGMFEQAIDPELARSMYKSRTPEDLGRKCTMCGDFCAIEILENALKEANKEV